jgi:hypothetical protein
MVKNKLSLSKKKTGHQTGMVNKKFVCTTAKSDGKMRKGRHVHVKELCLQTQAEVLSFGPVRLETPFFPLRYFQTLVL